MSAVEEYRRALKFYNEGRVPITRVVVRADAAIAELEAELAALKVRTCETCIYAGDINQAGTPCRVCTRIWGWVPLSSGCDEWEARA